jgi:hypothetical protein
MLMAGMIRRRDEDEQGYTTHTGDHGPGTDLIPAYHVCQSVLGHTTENDLRYAMKREVGAFEKFEFEDSAGYLVG